MIKLVRKNIRMSQEVAKFYEEKAESLGISQSALMVIALSHYIEYQKSIEFMGNDMKKFIELVEQVGEKEK